MTPDWEAFGPGAGEIVSIAVRKAEVFRLLLEERYADRPSRPYCGSLAPRALEPPALGIPSRALRCLRWRNNGAYILMVYITTDLAY